MSSDFDFNELTQSEEPADALLRALKYDFVDAAALDADRESAADPLLTRRLEAVLRRLNPWLSDDNLRKAVRAIRQVQAAGLIEANEKVHIALTHGVSVEQDLGSGKLGQTVHYIDYDHPENNEFLFTRQYRVAGPRVEIVADVAAFVNGIPLVVVECKSPTLEDPIGEGVLRLLRYQELTEEYRNRGAPRLFHTAQILIAACGQAAKFGTVGTPAEAYAPWKVPYPMTLDQLQGLLGRVPTSQDVLLAGLLQKGNLLDLLRNFIVFETSRGKTVRKLARYPQYVAANEAVKRVRTAKRAERRGGVIWHTQGSGKSLTMLYTSVKLRRLREAENPTLVVVTDRTDLDDQITGTFQRCGFPNPEQAKSVRDLRDLLSRGSGQTVMTTVQKFQDATSDLHPVLNTGENVFVFVDEAHRTQYKFLAANMRRALPRACFIGFTGTPIDRRDRSTFATFGPYIHTYTIEQSVADGATVPIYYEMRQSRDRVEGDDLDAAFDRVFAHLSEEERSRVRQKYGTRELIAGAPDRIERICQDLLEHYRTAIRPNGFKAQVVACSRDAAATYKETLDRLGAPESAIIMSTTNDDPEHIAKWATTKAEQRRLIDRFKDQDDPLCILIVCDMLLTGFDADVEQVMYLDAGLKEHTLAAGHRPRQPARQGQGLRPGGGLLGRGRGADGGAGHLLTHRHRGGAATQVGGTATGGVAAPDGDALLRRRRPPRRGSLLAGTGGRGRAGRVRPGLPALQREPRHATARPGRAALRQRPQVAGEGPQRRTQPLPRRPAQPGRLPGEGPRPDRGAYPLRRRGQTPGAAVDPRPRVRGPRGGAAIGRGPGERDRARHPLRDSRPARREPGLLREPARAAGGDHRGPPPGPHRHGGAAPRLP
jgi:type I restriction enzyme R subunit